MVAPFLLQGVTMKTITQICPFCKEKIETQVFEGLSEFDKKRLVLYELAKHAETCYNPDFIFSGEPSDYYGALIMLPDRSVWHLIAYEGDACWRGSKYFLHQLSKKEIQELIEEKDAQLKSLRNKRSMLIGALVQCNLDAK
jgi:hypothetical protein